MTKSHQTNRRRFLKTGALAAVAAPTIIPSSALGQAGKPAPSNRITVGLIGCGGRGVGVMNSFLNEPSAQVIATCDPYETHHRGQARGRALGRQPGKLVVAQEDTFTRCLTRKLLTYATGRELVSSDRPAIDAVLREMKQDNKGLRDLIEAVVLSEVFGKN